jgi:hypothetical protein
VIAMFCMGLPIFDIVNGFLNRCRGGIVVLAQIFKVCGWTANIITLIKLIIWLR